MASAPDQHAPAQDDQNEVNPRNPWEAVPGYGLENFIEKARGRAHMWHNCTVPGRSSKPRDHDFMTVGRRVVEQAIGEKLSGEPLDDANAGKNLKAVAAGKLGGKLGGVARSKSLSPDLRKQIARKVAQARWKPSSKDD